VTTLVPGPRPITVAILAMGGEGGGVLADWIVDLAEHGGYLVQATSVPGVAQRTGATVYYLELFPKAAAKAAGRDPVLALMPMPGDVDVVMASELMEAGRAVQRGFVTPDRTTFVASTHRVYAMTEKIALADGRVDEAALLEGCRTAARRFLAFNMAAIAEATRSPINAVLFGALGGTGALPFGRAAFEAAIRRGRVGVAASLEAFKAGFEAAQTGAAPTLDGRPDFGANLPPPTLDGRDMNTAAPAHPEPGPGLNAPLLDGLQAFPEAARTVVRLGLERLADYQDQGYAALFLERLRPFLALERQEADGRLVAEVARQLALAMAYEDTVRVAELKIRRSRFARVRDEVKLGPDQLLQIAEFFHPRVEEIADTLPERWGRWLLATPWARRAAARLTRKGRTVRTSSIRGFLTLYAVASLKRLRPKSLRYATEQRSLEEWLTVVRARAERDYDLAVEVAACRGLVKGYGETIERGRERFTAIMAVLPEIARHPDAAAIARSLRHAANADDTGAALAARIGQLSDMRQAAE
jgi:indolepyruvate ferredoxin oxidoreductase, beta subunit